MPAFKNSLTGCLVAAMSAYTSAVCCGEGEWEDSSWIVRIYANSISLMDLTRCVDQYRASMKNRDWIEAQDFALDALDAIYNLITERKSSNVNFN